MVMKYRVILGWVMVMRWVVRICSWKIGTTLPCDPSTLPKRTETQRMAEGGRAATINSAKRLVHPMKLVGCTALSDEIRTNPSQLDSCATSNNESKANTLFFSASCRLVSIMGTCL